MTIYTKSVDTESAYLPFPRKVTAINNAAEKQAPKKSINPFRKIRKQKARIIKDRII